MRCEISITLRTLALRFNYWMDGCTSFPKVSVEINELGREKELLSSRNQDMQKQNNKEANFTT